MSLHKQFTLSRLELTALGKNIRYLKSDTYKGIFFPVWLFLYLQNNG